MITFVAYGRMILCYGDWAQMLLEVLGVKINIFRDFNQLNELLCLGLAFKSWPLFKVVLFRKDTFNVHEP